MPPSDDRRDSPALRQEGPQQDELRKIIARMYAYIGKGSTEDAHVIANWATELEDALAALSASKANLAAAQARIQVLETSVDYLRYLVDHPVAPAEGEP